jgi:hypothetical protein
MGQSKKRSQVGIAVALILGVTLVILSLYYLLTVPPFFVPVPMDSVLVIGLSLGISGLALIHLALSWLCATIAKAKGRSWVLFFWIAVLINPIIMLIVAAAISPSDSRSTKSATVGIAQDSTS